MYPTRRHRQIRATSAALLLYLLVSAAAAPCRADLLAFYSFDDPAAPLADDSDGGRAASPGGGDPEYVAAGGFEGGAYRFRGGDRLTVPIDINPSRIPELTIGAWVRTDSLSDGLRKVIGHDDGAWDRVLGLDDRTHSNGGGQAAPALRYTAFTGTNNHGPVQDTPEPFNREDWTFLAAVYSQSASLVTVYVDLDARTTGDAPVATSVPTQMGTGHGTTSIGSIRPDIPNEGWVGWIDNVFFYDEALDAAALTALRDGGKTAAIGLPAPVVDRFSITPGRLEEAGEAATLRWEVRFADAVSIDPLPPLALPPEGSTEVVPEATTTYILSATGEGGTTVAEVTLSVGGDVLDPVLTEFMASNAGSLRDGEGNSPDWVELHNPNPFAIDLAGFALADAGGEWAFPPNELAGGAYLVVFASGRDPASGAVDAGGFLHATFALDRSGEPLRLRRPDGTEASAFAEVPEQFADISYGLDPATGAPAYFQAPTPGAPNAEGFEGFLADTRFSVDRGLFDAPIEVEITCATPGTSILYTTDGSVPSVLNGTTVLPSAPDVPGRATLTVSKTTVLRALATKPGFAPTNLDTQTYLFPADTVRQPADPPGFPASWGVFTGVNGGSAGSPVPADYAMNPAQVNPDPGAMEEALRSLPSLSIVMDPGDLFGVDGILQNPFGGVDGSGVYTTASFEPDRACSAEWIDPAGGPEFRVRCGIRVSGGWSRHYRASPKKSFSLLFRREFGPAKLEFPLFGQGEVDAFDRIVLRAIFSNAWPDAARPPDYLRDHFLRQTQLDMGQESARGTWVHLYLNGLYWGIYNPTERPDASFAASHFGGNKDDYDAVKHQGLTRPGGASNNSFEVIDGSAGAWSAALALASRGLADPGRYAEFTGLVDVANLADYIILNAYTANVDWPHKNWYANRGRLPGGLFRFYSWDGEYALQDLNNNRLGVNNANTPAHLYDRARANPEFRLLFADRVHRHCFNGGALTPGANRARYAALAAWIEPAIPAEAARWGDNGFTRQGATNYSVSHWRSARDGILNNFIANRHAVALAQFVAAGLYPDLEAPIFNLHGGDVPAGFGVSMRSRDTATILQPNGGAIYYTTDGSDPRLPGGAISPGAVRFRNDIPLSASTTFRARLLDGADWSALTEATFHAGTAPATAESLTVSKLNYRPAPPSAEEVAAGFDRRGDFEFIELLNRAATPLNLAGLRFVDGVVFTFAAGPGSEIAAGGRLLLVADRGAFEHRYGTGLPVAGVYSGQLSDDGERVALVDPVGQTVFAFTYNDRSPWPEAADGEGPALVLRDPEARPDLDDPASWRRSARDGGSPAADDRERLSTWLAGRGLDGADPAADPDGDGFSHFLEFAFGLDLAASANGEATNPRPTAVALRALPPAGGGDDRLFPTFSHRRRPGAEALDFRVETSTDLAGWIAGETGMVGVEDNGDGTETVTVRAAEPIPDGGALFFRLVVRQEEP